MSKRANYKAQVLDDPTNQQFFVRFKRKWHSRWEHDSTWAYRLDTKREKAFEHAHHRMVSLTTLVVVAESS